MLRQFFASVIVLAGAVLAWAFFVPGAQQTLANYGISLPFLEPADAAGATPQGARGRFANRSANVVTTPVTLATVNDGLTAIGQASAERSVTVTSPSGGTLVELMVRPGDMVEAGDVIGRLEAVTEQIAYDQAMLAAEDARNTLERQQNLARSNLVAATALDAAQLAADTAELELRSAEIALEKRSILSPIDGRVGLMQVTPGNYLAPQTAITTIDDTSSIEVDFWVPERYAASVERGMPVSVSAVALPGQTFEGEISAIDNRIDPESRTLQVRASIPNESGVMRAGMSFSVALRFPGQQFPAVNPLAILWSSDGSYVWKYENGTATQVMAEIVQRNSDGVLVRADLVPGDAIITEGILQLSEGSEVTLLAGPDGTQTVEAAKAETGGSGS